MGAPTITHQKHMRPISISMSIWNSIFWVLQNFWNFKTGQLEAKLRTTMLCIKFGQKLPKI